MIPRLLVILIGCKFFLSCFLSRVVPIFLFRTTIFCIGFFLAPAILSGCKTLDPRPNRAATATESRNLWQEGIMLLERGENQAAETTLAQAVRLNEKDAEIRRTYAESLWHVGKKQEAVEHLSEALLLTAKQDTKILLSLTEKCYELGHYETSLDCAEKAIDSADAKWGSTEENRLLISKAWVIRARIHRQNGRTELALNDYHKAISLCPKDQGLLSELATLQAGMGQPERALATWHSVSRMWPLDQEPQHVVFGRGDAYMAMQQYHLACDQFESANRRWPEDVNTYCRLAEAQLACGRVNDAAMIAQRAVEIAPENRTCIAMYEQVRVVLAQRSPAQPQQHLR